MIDSADSATLPLPVSAPSGLALAHVTGSPISTIAGLAFALPQIVEIAHTFALPTTAAGWLQIAFGIIALFMKG